MNYQSANIPRVIVENVTSAINGATKSTNIEIGGHRFAQENFDNHVLQLVNNLYYNTNKVRYTFGIDVMYTRAHSRYGSEVNGRFHYNGLAAFENNQPYRYYREVPLVADPSVVGKTLNTGIYGQLQTKLSKGLELTAGLRLDYAHYPSSPLNHVVLDELGLRTDNKLKSFVVQPRFQFTLDVNEKHTDYIRFGAGIFASDINNYITINNLVFDGKHSATVDVRAPNLPVPDFAGYREDPTSSPTLPAFQLPTINTNSTDAQVPVMYKANLSYSHYFTPKLKIGITGIAKLGLQNYMYVDRNIAAQQFFSLDNEDNRGVYVPLSTMFGQRRRRLA
ncbi:MAG: hypothetical protein WKI04_09580 [Ferruginibacter sp.]